MTLYGIKLNISGGYLTIGRNLKRHFQMSCFKFAPIAGISVVTAEPAESMMTQPGTIAGLPTNEPEEFKKAMKETLWDKKISKEDRLAVENVCKEFPMVFAHGSRQLGCVTTDEFDIQLTVEGDKHPPCLQKRAYPASPQWQKDKETNFKVGDQILVSTIHFNNSSPSPKLKDPFIGPFTITELVGKNAVRVELFAPFARRHNVFPVSLVKLYKESDTTRFPNRASRTKKLPMPAEEEAITHQVLNKRTVGSGKKKELQYLVTFKKKSSNYDRWVPATQIPEAGRLLCQLRQDDRETRAK